MQDSLGEAISVDASGSRRELPALSVVVAAGQEVKGEHVIEAALRLIQGEGRVELILKMVKHGHLTER